MGGTLSACGNGAFVVQARRPHKRRGAPDGGPAPAAAGTDLARERITGQGRDT